MERRCGQDGYGPDRGQGGREVDGDVPGEDEYRLRTQLAGNIREKGRFRVDEEWPGEARAGEPRDKVTGGKETENQETEIKCNRKPRREYWGREKAEK